MKKLLILLLGCFLVSACKEQQPKRYPSDINPKELATKEAIEKQESNLKITPIAHATMVLEWNDIVIYIDPVGGAKAFKDQKQPALILITDVHGDHLSVETLETLNTKNTKIIVPQAVADKLPNTFASQIYILNNGDSTEHFGISTEAIPMYNLREEALKFHEKGRGNGYVLTIDEKRLYFSGDTEDIPEMRALQNIDKAFICMNLPYTMTPESAADAVLEFKPKQVYPYHYRGNPDVSDVAKFKELVNAEDLNIEVIQLDWYPNEEY